MEAITKEQAKVYVESGGGYCPICENDDIIYGAMEADGDTAEQKITCGACGFQWFDTFKLTNIHTEV
jgi:hypothetical protein